MFKDFKKFIFIFSLLFVLLLSLGAISASEDLDNQMADSVSELAIDEGLAAVNEVDADNEIISNEEIETEIEKSDEDNILSEETPSNTITVNGKTYDDIQTAINESNDGDIIELSGNFELMGIDVLEKNLVFKGNSNTIIDGKNLSTGNLVYACNANISLIGLTFKNSNNFYYGAVHLEDSNCSMIDCSFINNSVSEQSGGAIYVYNGNVSMTNCSFTNNSAKKYGGAIIIYDGDLSMIGCSFINNSAGIDGGAVFGYCSSMIGCSFINNSVAEGSGGAIELSCRSSIINCNFTDNFAYSYGGAIYMDFGGSIVNCSFIRNKLISSGKHMWGGGAISFSDYTSEFGIKNNIIDCCNFINNTVPTSGSAIYICTIFYPIKLTISNCNFSNNLAKGNFTSSGYEFKSYGNGAVYHINGNNNNNNISFVNCNGLVKNTDKFKLKMTITAPNVSMVYKGGKYLIVTLKNEASNSKYKGLKISIKLNGKTYTKTTNSKGQVKLLLGNLIPKNYTATVSFAGDNFYLKTSKSVKVVVKKATPKLTASAKTFRVKVKTKKYTVTLKNHKNTVLKSYKLTLRVNGKTFSAKTNSKGKATFKITNLKKRGTFKAVIKYAGNKYYKKISKTVKITVKK